jgi:hypothetical protein
MHCGSTFLDVVLGNSPDVQSVGELVNGLNRGRDEACACGFKIHECEFWSRVIDEYNRDGSRDIFHDVSFLFKRSDIRKFISAYLPIGSLQKGDWDRYAEIDKDLVTAIGNVSGKNAIVDSSKEFTRSLMVAKGNSSAKVIHLLRKPVSIVGSYYWRQQQGSPFYFMKKSYTLGWLRFPALVLVAFSWNVGVAAALLIQLNRKGQVLHVIYEDFCEDPARELARISKFCDIDLTDVIDAIEQENDLLIGHSLAGNAEIKDGTGFKLIPNKTGRREMPWLYRLMTLVVSFPGYLLTKFAL